MNYGGLEEKYSQYDHSSIVVVPVPYDGTSTWIKGADKGPDAIIEASANMELYDIESDSEVFRQGICTSEPVIHKTGPEGLADKVEAKITAMLKESKFPVIIGGEHSVSIGAFRAFAGFFKDFSILQLDAHSDLRHEYDGSNCNHACVMARAKEVAPITQVGIRSMDMKEKMNMSSDRIFFRHLLRENKSWIRNVSDQLAKNVYITIDLDVFDPSIMPSTGTPEPDGLMYNEVMELLKIVNNEHSIVGFDVVELCPNEKNKAPDFLASKLIYQLLSLRFNSV